MIILLSELPGITKPPLLQHAKNKLAVVGLDTEIIGGDECRAKIGIDRFFSRPGRKEMIMRLGFVICKFLWTKELKYI